MSSENDKINTEANESSNDSKKFGEVTESELENIRKAEPEDIKEKEPAGVKNEILEWCESFVFAMLIVQLLFIFVFRQVMVDGPSMENTLHDGDRLIMTHMNYEPKRDDIVVVYSEPCDNKIIIKRVIGIEGDKVVVDYNTNHVYVNDEEISNEHIKAIMDDSILFDQTYAVSEGVYEYEVPEDMIFVMGDNRNNSKDSRSIGFVENDTVWGHAVFRFYPFNKLGKI